MATTAAAASSGTFLTSTGLSRATGSFCTSCDAATFFLSCTTKSAAAPRSTCATASAWLIELSDSWYIPAASCATAHHSHARSSPSAGSTVPAHSSPAASGGSSQRAVKSFGVAPRDARTERRGAGTGVSASARCASSAASRAARIASGSWPSSTAASQRLSISWQRTRCAHSGSRGNKLHAISSSRGASAAYDSCIAHSAMSLSRHACAAGSPSARRKASCSDAAASAPPVRTSVCSADLA